MAKLFSRFTDCAKVRLDVKDWRIINCLCRDARMPLADIAVKCMMGRDTVAYRIRRLQQKGVIAGFVPVIPLERFGFHTYRVFLLLHEKERGRHQALIDEITNHSSTLSVMLYTDTWDAEWVLAAHDLNEVEALVEGLLLEYGSVVLRKQILPVLQEYISRVAPGKEVRVIAKNSQAPLKLSARDAHLLQLLCEDARKSSYDLCGRLGCSPDTVSRRLKALLAEGIISGFQPVINIAALGREWYTYALTFATPEKDSKIEEFVASQQSVVHAEKMFGQWNVLLTIAPESGKAYHELVKSIKNAFAETIHDYQTWLAHEEIVYRSVPKMIFESTEAE